jgi:hypothetical protein
LRHTEIAPFFSIDQLFRSQQAIHHSQVTVVSAMVNLVGFPLWPVENGGCIAFFLHERQQVESGTSLTFSLWAVRVSFACRRC